MLNGQSGLDERADRYLSDPRIAQAVTVSSAQEEMLREMIQRRLLESDFGLHPETDWSKHGPSPHAEAALREFFHGQEKPIPEAMASFIAGLDASALPDVKAAIYHRVDFEAGETMREALGALDVLVARSPSKDTPIFFDIVGATNREQFETAVGELEEHCRRRGYNLVGSPGWSG